jgi:CYTH domain-containing protein
MPDVLQKNTSYKKYNKINKNFINFNEMQEIEKKFLVKGDFTPFVSKSTRIVQGYLSSVPERTVRVRIKGTQGFLTIKGIGNDSGASRFEFEKEITVTRQANY